MTDPADLTAEQIAELRREVELDSSSAWDHPGARAALLDAAERCAEAEDRLAKERLARAVIPAEVIYRETIAGLEEQLAEATRERDQARRRCGELFSMLATEAELAANGTAVIKQVQERACEIEKRLAEAEAELAKAQEAKAYR